MARDLFSQNPLDRAMGLPAPEIRGALRPGKSGGGIKAPKVEAPDLDSLSASSGLPRNLIEALNERPDASTLIADLSTRARAGEDLGAVVRGLPEGDTLAERANAIADERAGVVDPGNTAVGNFGRTFGGAAVSMTGGAAEMGGALLSGPDARQSEAALAQGLDGRTDADSKVARGVGALRSAVDAPLEVAGGAIKALGRWISGAGESVTASVDPEFSAAGTAAMPSGNLMKPSTWKAPEDLSVGGLAAASAQILGSLAPSVIPGLALGRSAAVTAGGLAGGGAGRDQARQMLDQLAASGELQTNSQVYKSGIKAGLSHEDATAAAIEAGVDLAGVLTMPVSALGGGLTDAILRRGAAGVAAGNIATRVAGGAALSGIEEGTQEAIEGVAAGAGARMGADADAIDPMANTLGDFVMGALGGGPLGAAGGIPGGAGRGALPPAATAPAVPPAAVAPAAPLVAPGAPPVAEDEEQDDDFDPSEWSIVPATATSPATVQNGVTGEVLDEAGWTQELTSRGLDPATMAPGTPLVSPAAAVVPPEPVAPPLGPLASIAASLAPAAAPAPEEVPPPLRFPDMKAGAEVTLSDPAGRSAPYVFLREEGEEVVVRDHGEELRLGAREFDEARLAGAQVVAAQEAAAKAPKAAEPEPTDPAVSARVAEYVGKYGMGDEQVDALMTLAQERADFAEAPLGADDIDAAALRFGYMPDTLAEPAASADPAEPVEAYNPDEPATPPAAPIANPNPTPAQVEEGNYKKKHLRWNGLDVSIETERGMDRKGVGKDGKPWSVTLQADYGYIRKTVGADNDHLDVYMGPVPDAPSVLVVDQIDLETGAFDETKSMVGFGNPRQARAAYIAGFSDGKGEQRIGAFKVMTADAFKAWATTGDTKSPIVMKADAAPQQEEAVNVPPSVSSPSDQQPASDRAPGAVEQDQPAGSGGAEAGPAPATDDPAGAPSQPSPGQDAPADDVAGERPAGVTPRPNARQASNLGKAAAEAGQPREVPRALAGGRTGPAWEKGWDENAPNVQPETATSSEASVAPQSKPDAQIEPEPKVSDPPSEPVADDAERLVSEALDDVLGPEPKAEPAAEPEAIIDTPAPDSEDAGRITAAFVEAFARGDGFRSIVAARTLASSVIGRPLEVTDYLMMEEAIEAAVVIEARRIVAETAPDATYEALVDLYSRQPILGERVPEKMRFQAYSTPAPLAYVASRLAGIGANTRVLEPTAGNGMLLIGADPANAQANELQPHRAKQLRAVLGSTATVTESDATQMTFAPFDSLITNPPFGALTDQDTQDKTVWPLGVTTTNQIDHAIAWRALEAMPNDGRAVLILGGVKKQLAGEDRKRAYQERAKTTFFKQVYDTYNVVDHFTVAGSLYQRQGAAWPVDVVVIDGRAASSRDYPMKTPPVVLSSWDEIQGKLTDAPDVDTTDRRPGAGNDPAAGADAPEQGPVPDPAGDGDRASSEGSGTGRDAVPGVGGSERGADADGPVAGGRRKRAADGQRGARAGAGGSDLPGASDTGRGGVGSSDALGNDDGALPQRGVGEAAGALAGDAAASMAAVSDALLALFGGPGKLNSGLSFDEESYKAALPHFKTAARAMGRVGQDIKDIVRGVVQWFVDTGWPAEAIRKMRPYLVRFVQDVSAGREDPFAETKRANTEEESEFQVQYGPRSKAAFAVGTLVPRPMQDAVTAALDKIEAEHGSIDGYVARELGYSLEQVTGSDTVKGYFSAEQVDALAMAISNVAVGKGFIIGDQTGVGKGRFVAAMLRYGMQKGRVPLFVTQKPGLYADMIRDLRDIGMAEVQDQVFTTNVGLDPVPITGDDDTFKGSDKASLNKTLAQLRDTGTLPDGKKLIFTTYDQMKGKAGKDGAGTVWPLRAMAIRAAAPNLMVVLDESHTAGGPANPPRNQKKKVEGAESGPENMADLFREIVGKSAGSVFSSATYAKNPQVMSLYASTDLSLAVASIDELAAAIQKGGVPLQQVVANALTRAGQYVRRERSFAGVDFGSSVLEADRDVAKAMSIGLAQIARFDKDVMEPIREQAQASLMEEGAMAVQDNSVGVASASSAGFASVVHNLAAQFLLAVKIDQAVALAVDAWRAGEKPVITLMNVNTGIVQEYLTEKGATPGQEIRVPFTAIVERYLDRLRTITVEMTDGTKKSHLLTDKILGPGVVQQMNALRAMIKNLPIDAITGSPVDAILDGLRDAGMSADEITGRSMVIDRGVVGTRTSTSSGNKRLMNAFNVGKLDALVLSASGSTGFSLHATGDKKTNDGKRRHMIVLQAHADINVFMQTLGRVHRTGQIVLPKISIAFSDLSIEKRAAAVLMKKMASLNANTTAGKKGATTLTEVVDFVNEVGDRVMAEYLALNPDLADFLNVGTEYEPDLAKKATGRMIYLTPDDADLHLEALEEAYVARIQTLDEAGENPLEAKTLDLQAKTISSEIVTKGGGSDSPLDADLVSEQVSVRMLGEPHKPEAVKEMVAAALGTDSAYQWQRKMLEQLDEAMPAHLTGSRAKVAEKREALVALEEAERDAISAEQGAKDALTRATQDGLDAGVRSALTATVKQNGLARDRATKAANQGRLEVKTADDRVTKAHDTLRGIKQTLSGLVPGSVFTIKGTMSGDTTGIVVNVDMGKVGSNPTAAGRIKVRFAVADARREVGVSLNQIMQDPKAYEAALPGFDGYPAFSKAAGARREERTMMTGNLIGAVNAFGDKGGQVVLYTREDGTTHPGMLLPKTFDLKKAMDEKPVVFTGPDQAVAFLGQVNGMVSAEEGMVKIVREGTQYALTIAKNRGKGKPFFLLGAVQDFVYALREQGTNYTGRIPADNLAPVLDAYTRNLGTVWYTDSYKDEARTLLAESGGKERRATADVPIERSDVAALTATLAAEMTRSGLDGKVTARAVARILDRAGIPIMGRYADAKIDVAAGPGALGTLRHEIVHALRDLGLFTDPEWRGLVRAARADKAMQADVRARYRGQSLSESAIIEEVIAETYTAWAAANDGAGGLAKALGKVRAFLEAVANALRGRGFQSAALTFERMAAGQVGGRGPDTPSGGPRERRASTPAPARTATGQFRPSTAWVNNLPKGAKAWAKDSPSFFSNLLTDSMGGAKGVNLLALVPLRPLLSEVGREMHSTKAFLNAKEKMDALRQEWQAKAAGISEEWMGLNRKGRPENASLMDIMHRATLSGLDPAKPFDSASYDDARAVLSNPNSRKGARDRARDVLSNEAKQLAAYAVLKAEFDALPAEYQGMFSKVRDSYDELANEFDDAILGNLKKASEAAIKRAERSHRAELRRITDEGLTGLDKTEAVDAADRAMAAVKARGGWGLKSRMIGLRAEFESNRLKGPYFPLARFGNYFLTIRDDQGKIVSFSRYETAKAQKAAEAGARGAGQDVQVGVLDNADDVKGAIDPDFIVGIEKLMGDYNADPALMDAVWQRWLETLPDQSIRTSKIHRKGRRGYSEDALRAFSHHSFHGAHQLARLRYGTDLNEALAEARLEAREASDPNRAGMIVNEMALRHKFLMSPTGGALASSISALTFIWYLGMTPAAALANISQTTVMGPAILGAAYPKIGTMGALKALGIALRDIGVRAWTDPLTSPRLTADERAALEAAYQRGTIDKTQAHDLASVAESGVEFNGRREAVMRFMSQFFHKAEVLNRTSTFLAAYRMARSQGIPADDAIERGADLTWKTHFDYQNTSRPRVMQSDTAKVLLAFRQFSVNMLFRLSRDTHQAFNGATPALRQEAKTQLAAITLSMMAHAGIRGTWGYGLTMTLLGLALPGADDDDIERYLQDSLLWDEETPGSTAWNMAAGAAMNGIPGQALGLDLKERIGMPNLWFRGDDRDQEAEDTVLSYIVESLGPSVGIPIGIARGVGMMAEGEWWRGTEAAVPKVVRDTMRFGRYSTEGITTVKGDDLLPGAGLVEAIKQGLGFVPANVAERYERNTRMMNRQNEAAGERSSILRDVAKRLQGGETIDEGTMERLRTFNTSWPEWAIDMETIRSSMGSRARASQRNEFGLQLNPRINDRIREEEAPLVYGP